MTGGLSVKERLGRAFRRAYEDAGMSQEALSDALGIKQTNVSKYARGAVLMPLDVIERVEDACGYRRGHILRLAGFVEDDVDLVTAIRTHPTLSADEQDALMRVYDVFRRDSQPKPTVTEQPRSELDQRVIDAGLLEPVNPQTGEPLFGGDEGWREIKPPFDDPWEREVWSRDKVSETERQWVIFDHRRKHAQEHARQENDEAC